MSNVKRIGAGVSLFALGLCGCGTINTAVQKEIALNDSKVRDMIVDKPVQPAPMSRVSEVRGKLMPVTATKSAASVVWLKQVKVTLDIRNPTPLTAVVAKLGEQGLNIVCDLPLDSYFYVGKINATDAEAALKSILGSSGLDFQADNVRKLVLIKPMSSRTWTIPIGNRKSTYASDHGATSSNAQAPAWGAPGTPGGSGGIPGMGIMPPGAPAGGMGQSSNSAASGTGVSSTDDFWPSLDRELGKRLTMLVPRSVSRIQQPGQPDAANAGMPRPGPNVALPNPNMPPPMGAPTPMGGMGAIATPGAGTDFFVPRLIGQFSTNPETGSVNVQAPHWILSELDEYFKTVMDMYNTDITFQGEIVLVTNTRTDSEGMDVAAFGRWASGRYGLAVSNNPLGGVTISGPSGSAGPIISAGNQAVGGGLAGLTFRGATSAMDLFNAYLSQIGELSIIESPLVTTTHGVAGVFSTKETTYYNTVSQQAAAAGTGSAATATQNILVAVETGTELRINPRIDLATGLIRAQLTLNQIMKSGSQTLPQTISTGNSSQTINTTIPNTKKQNVQGEILVRDGDLVVVGGQTVTNLTRDDNGLPGEDGPLAGLFGVKKATRARQIYYFALRVTVNRRQ